MTNKATPFAQSRIDTLLARMFAIAAALLSIELISNAMVQQPLLNPIWFWISFGAVITAQLGSVLGAYVFGNMKFWYRALAITSVLALICWPLQVADAAALPEHFKPWIWWAVGFSSLASVGAFRLRRAIIFLFAVPVIWIAIRISPAGGGSSALSAIEDSLYTFFFATSMALLVLVLKHQTALVDDAHQQKIESAISIATSTAMNRERIRVTSMVHDKVLSTLAMAALPDDAKQRAAVAASATESIQRLGAESKRIPGKQEQVSTKVFLDALQGLLSSQAPGFAVKSRLHEDCPINYDQAIALAEATVQAALNSLEHAPQATDRVVNVTSSSSKLKVIVKDNGYGFRVSGLSRTNLSVRHSIIKKLEAFGVTVHLDTSEGTCWIYEVKHCD